MPIVRDSDILAFEPMVNALARRFVGIAGAEYDDLRQEGMIFLWLTLEKGIAPSADLIAKRMISWTRFLRRYSPVPYDELLPMELG